MAGTMAAGAVAVPNDQARELYTDIDEKTARLSTRTGIHQRLWGLEARTDSNVTFEEYRYWAEIEREMENEEHRRHRAIASNRSIVENIKGYFTSQPKEANPDASRSLQVHEERRIHSENDGQPRNSLTQIPSSETHDFDAEWRQAARALRTAGWGSIFYLITTDILGFTQVPAVFAATGYGQGAGIFVLMGLAAGLSGYMLFRTYVGLDSSRFPMLSYGDPYLRVFGRIPRHIINVLQSLLQFCTVALIVLSNASIISQLAHAKLCYVVCIMITMFVGMASGLIRSLKHLGWFCNFAVWLNIATLILICIVASQYGPDPTVAVQTTILSKDWLTNPAPVTTFVDTPPADYQQFSRDLFAAKFAGGINSIVYAYSGSILFIAFMSEMRRPMDFWKAMVVAQVFIACIYIFFGAFVYSKYGQYSYANISQSVQPEKYQIVANVMNLGTALLAVFLYFNVGLKTVYLEVGQEILGLPPIITRKGRLLWYSLGPFYWILAFIVASSVPQFSQVVSFVGGMFSINFTYSFSGLLFAGYLIQDGARLPGEGFDPRTGLTTRHDNGLKRVLRGLSKTWYITIPVIIYTLLGFAASGMGTWAAIEGLISAFSKDGSLLTSWGCTAPGG